jgi:hypothetical protein
MTIFRMVSRVRDGVAGMSEFAVSVSWRCGRGRRRIGVLVSCAKGECQ